MGDSGTIEFQDTQEIAESQGRRCFAYPLITAVEGEGRAIPIGGPSPGFNAADKGKGDLSRCNREPYPCGLKHSKDRMVAALYNGLVHASGRAF